MRWWMGLCLGMLLSLAPVAYTAISHRVLT